MPEGAGAGRRVSSTKNKNHKGRWKAMDADQDRSDDQVRALGKRASLPPLAARDLRSSSDKLWHRIYVQLNSPVVRRFESAGLAAKLPAFDCARVRQLSHA